MFRPGAFERRDMQRAVQSTWQTALQQDIRMHTGSNLVIERGASLRIAPGATVAFPWTLTWPLPVQDSALALALKALQPQDVFGALEAASLVLRRLRDTARQLDRCREDVASGLCEAVDVVCVARAQGCRVPDELEPWINDAASRFAAELERARVRADKADCALESAIVVARRWIAGGAKSLEVQENKKSTADAGQAGEEASQDALPSEIVALLQGAALTGASSASGFCNDLIQVVDEVVKRSMVALGVMLFCPASDAREVYDLDVLFRVLDSIQWNALLWMTHTRAEKTRNLADARADARADALAFLRHQYHDMHDMNPALLASSPAPVSAPASAPASTHGVALPEAEAPLEAVAEAAQTGIPL